MADRTFLITDIEGSTRLVQLLGDEYPSLLREHNELITAAVEAVGGQVVHVHGDSFLCTFDDAPAALRAAIDAQRALLAHRFVDGLPVRVRMGMDRGEAVWTGDTFVGLPLHVAARISAAAQGGRVLVSEAVADACRGGLPDDAVARDLGLHQLKDVEQPVRIFDLRHPDLATDHAPIRTESARSHNLPAPITRFIGRTIEVREVKKLLDMNRLVTLIGVGGAGKTRLAVQVGGDLVEDFSDGVWLSELVAASHDALVPRVVARALGVTVRPGLTDLDAICDHLATRTALLVLDNCEHVIDGAAKIADSILTRCPGVKIVATSREPLQIHGELRWSIPPMELPVLDEEPEMAGLSEAVALFADRATSSKPDFSIDAVSLPAVAEICRRLDGIPLAIELAADQVRTFHPAEIARLLSERFELLGERRGGVDHHRSLHASLEWSYELLPDPLRAAFRALGVFAGSFTIEAAEVVLAAPAHRIIAQLADRSLLTFDGERRYGMLETVRAYAVEQLESESEDRRARDALVRWAVALCREAVPHFRGAEKGEWLDRCEAELPNLRVAIKHAMDHDRDAARVIVDDLFTFWDVRGYREEGRGLATSLLDGEPSPVLAALARVAGSLSDRLAEYDRGEEHLSRALDISESIGDVRGQADACRAMGSIAWSRSDPTRCAQMFERALALYEQIGQKNGLAQTLHGLAVLARQSGDLDLAAERYQRSLDIYIELGDQEGIATDLTGLAAVAWRRGRLDEAREHQSRAVDIHRGANNKMWLAGGVGNLGILEMESGRAERAVPLFEESCALAEENGDQRIRTINLANLGMAYRLLGDAHLARSIWEECAAIQRAIETHGELALTLGHLSELAVTEGRLDDAEGLLAEGMELAERAARADARAALTQTTALVALARSDTVEARARAREVLEAVQAEGSERAMLGAVLVIGRIAIADGLGEQAMRLLAGADAVARAGLGYPMLAEGTVDPLIEQLLARDPGLEAAREEGATMTLDDLVARALET